MSNSCFSDYHGLCELPRLVLVPVIGLALDMYLTSPLLTSNSVNNFDYMEIDGRGWSASGRCEITVRSRERTRTEISLASRLESDSLRLPSSLL